MRVLILILLLSALVPLDVPADEYQQREQERQALRADMEAIEERLTSRHGRLDRVSAELAAIEQRIGDTLRRLDRLERERGENAARVENLAADRRLREADVAGQRAYLRKVVREAYLRGNQHVLKVLLDQQDPAVLDRLMVYFDYLGEARRSRITTAMEQLRALAAVETELAREREALAEVEREQRQEAAALEQRRREREAVLADVRDGIEDDSERLRQLQEDEERLSRLLDELRDALADIPEQSVDRPSFASLRGDLPWPVDGQVAARFGSDAGRLDGEWEGLLINADGGEPVAAVSHGRIVFADWLRGFGLLLIIDHGEGYMTLYGHNDALYVDVGDWVDTGQVIAAAGSSGGRDSNGVYFELRVAGQPDDPLNWLRRRS